MSASPPSYAVVVPTVGRPSLLVLLRSLAAQHGPLPGQLVVVDDRPDPVAADAVSRLVEAAGLPEGIDVRVVRSFGRGPAAARNLGWQLCGRAAVDWISFLDDDVVLPPGWCAELAADLAATPAGVAASQGVIVVPLPEDRRPTDWERSTAGLQSARWATADMCYRRDVLEAVGGFDERFPRAYREDADLALRVRLAGSLLARGSRRVWHPVRPAGGGISLRVQRGNADDALMRRLHGRRWRLAAETGRGRLPWHAATAGSGLLALGCAVAAAALRLTGRTDTGSARALRTSAIGASAAWAALTVDFARRRIGPGPKDLREVATMAWTSVAIPPAAIWHRGRGWWQHRRAQPWPRVARAVLFDRDGTLVHDVPYNGDPGKVAPVPGARAAVERLRSGGVRVGVVSNQSGVGRGLLTAAQVDSVNAVIDERIGPFDTWQVCVHGPDDGCGCRKPLPGLIRSAAKELGVPPEQCVVIGDIGADAEAARAAGARAILVPTEVTRAEEIAAAPVRASDLGEAVELALGWSRG